MRQAKAHKSDRGHQHDARKHHHCAMGWTEFRNDWDFRTILRGESDRGSPWGTEYRSNIQQLYERIEDGPINPVDAILGPRVTGSGATKTESIIKMVQKHDDLMVINDEAHHVHDDELEWSNILEKLHKDLVKRTGNGLIAQLDFSATPKDQNGKFFPWIVSDYPLAQAVEDKIVKAPLVVHRTDRNDPDKYSNAAVAYQEWIQIALNRWREHRDAFKKVDVKPVLFVMAQNTKDADAIAESIRRETDIKEKEVLVIHVSERGAGKGEITAGDLGAAREAARSIDQPGNKIKVVVSVLMLREGWDVRNVTVILGLRPFSSDANILPEQAVGRGLRLIRDMPSDYAQVVEIVGTPKFEEFVKELEIEGVGVGSVKTPPPPGVHIFPMKDRTKYDINIPQLSQTYSRNYKDIRTFHIALLSIGRDPVRLETWRPATKSLKFDPDQVFLQDVLAGLTQGIIRTAKLGCQFKDVYPIVEGYVAKRFFGGDVELNNPTVARRRGKRVLKPLRCGALFWRSQGGRTPICIRTLRKQVLEYIKYTNRPALVQEFIPSREEQRLYDVAANLRGRLLAACTQELLSHGTPYRFAPVSRPRPSQTSF